jgi:cyclohexyl-isocyanide hydratase
LVPGDTCRDILRPHDSSFLPNASDRRNGSVPAHERVVVDRNRITGGGVTAGIDFGLAVAAEIYGGAVAQEIRLTIEYGVLDTVPADVVARVTRMRRHIQSERRAIAERATSGS